MRRGCVCADPAAADSQQAVQAARSSTTPAGRLVLCILGMINECQREPIIEGTRMGLEAAVPESAVIPDSLYGGSPPRSARPGNLVLSLLCGLRTEEARAPALGARGPERRPGRQPARPAARGRVAIGPRARRDQDRTVPPHPRPARGGGSGAAGLVRQPGRRAARGRGRLAGYRAGVHQPPRRRAGRGKRPEDVQTHLRRSRDRGRLDPARAAHLLRQLDEPPRSPHRGDRPPRRARHHPHHRDRLPPRTTPPSSPPAPRSWTSSSQQPNPAGRATLPTREHGAPRSAGPYAAPDRRTRHATAGAIASGFSG
jgi:hypothetical protein